MLLEIDTFAFLSISDQTTLKMVSVDTFKDILRELCSAESVDGTHIVFKPYIIITTV